MKKKTILFYSSVKLIDEFNTHGFYSEDISILQQIGYKVVCTNKLSDFLYQKYDIAFLYFYKKSAIAALIANLIRRKKVFFTGGIDDLSEKVPIPLFRRLVFNFLYIFCYLFSTKVNIVSSTDLLNVKRVLNFVNIQPKKLLLFPHSHSFINIQVPYCNKLDNFVTVCWMKTVGNVKRKGVDKALLFFSKIYKLFPNSKFYIIGSLGDGVEYLKNLDYFEEIKDRVIFTGFINDSEKNKLLTLSRFYLQFSNYEGFGLAALEANLFKCFVFHSGSGGFLKTDDIWGKQILIDDNVNIFNLFKQIDFKLEEDLFDFRYNSLVEKYSRYERMLNIKNMIYEY